MGPITQARARELFTYDPETGVFVRLVAVGRGKAGDVVGTKCVGYLATKIDGHHVYLHRLAVLYMTGEWPEYEVDHRDTDRMNNRWENLRSVTKQVNRQNRRRSRSDRVHGTLMGVKQHRRRWQARINDTFLGSFATEQEAHDAYVIAKRRLHEGCTL